MFPLGTVLFPAATLTLRVFEPRYREMVARCMAGDRCFGVVLIARGSEVGGGDLRHDVGTVARIEAAAPGPAGQWALLVRGTARVEVRAWLEDDPYPRALVVDHPSSTGAADFDAARRALRRAHRLLSELGRSALSAAEIDATGPDGPDADPGAVEMTAWRLCAMAPVTALDRQHLLEGSNLGECLDLLCQVTDEMTRDLERLLASGPADDRG
jgi:uncharacterized protein